MDLKHAKEVILDWFGSENVEFINDGQEFSLINEGNKVFNTLETAKSITKSIGLTGTF